MLIHHLMLNNNTKRIHTITALKPNKTMTSSSKLLVIPMREEKTPSISRTKPEPLLDSSKTLFLRLQTHAVWFSFVFSPLFLLKKHFKKTALIKLLHVKYNKVSEAFETHSLSQAHTLWKTSYRILY